MATEGGLLPELLAPGELNAEQLLEAYNGPWKGDVRRVFTEYAF